MRRDYVSRLMVGVSGVRGFFGDELTVDVAERFAHAFGTLHPGIVVVGRDSRKSGQTLLGGVIGGLAKAGCRVIDLGIAATPTVEMAVTARDAAGGIIITASHNPSEWNGLKFLGPDGVFLTGEECTAVIGLYDSPGDLDSSAVQSEVTAWVEADKHHLDAILALDRIDRDLITEKKFTVCLDPNNGAGGPICMKLLELLGCRIHVINGETTGDFAHDAEPVPENLDDICGLVREVGADIGFAVDPDVDRLSLVDERGDAPGEEYSLALATEFVMSHGAESIACNLSTSRMVDDVAASHGGRVHRSPVGEIHVVEKMRETGAPAGGEGNGGIILSELHPGRDAVLGIALILQLLAERGKPLSALVDTIPRYHMIKVKTPIREKDSWQEPVMYAFPEAEVDILDGVKLILPDSWVHVRESNTEPVVRIIAEAPDKRAAQMLIIRVFEATG